MILGYVTSGFAYHTLEDALRLLHDIGYRSAAITLDRHHLDPFGDDRPARVRRIGKVLGELSMRCTIETGARFLLDPARKHHPTLMSARQEDRGRRIDFLCRAIDIASELGADSVSLWSGAADDDAPGSVLLDRLHAGLAEVLDCARRRGVRLGFEPEPGMFIERMRQFERLHQTFSDGLFGLTLDVGHVHCLDDGDLYAHLRRWSDHLFNVHIEDMRRARHEHLFFGEGEMSFAEIVGMLSAVAYAGPVHVELSRHSHDAPRIAQRAYDFLSGLWPQPDAEPKS